MDLILETQARLLSNEPLPPKKPKPPPGGDNLRVEIKGLELHLESDGGEEVLLEIEDWLETSPPHHPPALWGRYNISSILCR